MKNRNNYNIANNNIYYFNNRKYNESNNKIENKFKKMKLIIKTLINF